MPDEVEMLHTTIAGRWDIILPRHRYDRFQELPMWEAPRLNHMHANILPSDTVFDIGSEEGDLSGLYAMWTSCDKDAQGDVLLVEPNPLVWPNIRAIWEANAFPAPVGYFVGFASDKLLAAKNPAPSLINRDGWPGCAFGPIIADHGFRTIWERADDTPQITIDILAMRHGSPDVITMDIEGAELVALHGAERTLSNNHPLVYVSIHKDFMPDYGHTPEMLTEYMTKLGYAGDFIAMDHEVHLVFSHPKGRKVVRPQRP